jgi:ribonuclease VapC
VTLVLDASSVLVFLHDEPGSERVWSVLSQAVVGTVNWSEVVQKSLRREVDITGMREEFVQAGVVFSPFTVEQAEIAALLWDKTRHLGLSLGDRACLALAMEQQLPILTADRAWSELDLGLQIQLVR